MYVLVFFNIFLSSISMSHQERFLGCKWKKTVVGKKWGNKSIF